MIRWANIANAILTAYVGAEATFITAQSRYAYAQGTNRIVAYPTDGVIGEPSIAAQNVLLESLAPSAISVAAGTVDDLIFERRVNAAFEIWAPDAAQAESRLHALLCAINDVMNTALQITGLRESWPQSQGDIASGGCLVVLNATFTILVLKSDARVVSVEAAPVGSGTPTDVVTTIEIQPSLNDEEIEPTIQETET